MTDHIETAPTDTAICDSCQGPVLRRRPSVTGKHFCSKPECAKAKARFYYRRRADGVATSVARQAEIDAQVAEASRDARDAQLVAFIGAAAKPERTDCGGCQRPAVIPGYPHPNPAWDAVCTAVGSYPMPAEPITQRIMLELYPMGA